MLIPVHVMSYNVAESTLSSLHSRTNVAQVIVFLPTIAKHYTHCMLMQAWSFENVFSQYLA